MDLFQGAGGLSNNLKKDMYMEANAVYLQR